jgi:hypothetical protein
MPSKMFNLIELKETSILPGIHNNTSQQYKFVNLSLSTISKRYSELGHNLRLQSHLDF